MKKVVSIRKKNDFLMLTIYPIEDWDGFEKLILFVKKYYNAKVLEEYDGPGSRKWILEADGKQFELIHDDGYGNYFLARTAESEPVILEIGKDLEERLKDLPEDE